MTVGPHKAKVFDFAACAVDEIVDAKSLDDQVVTLKASNFRADLDEGMSGFVVLR